MKQDIDMNHIINAFKNLPRRGQHNFVKILCLALGLAISSVIIAEIYFEQTYDTYFPGWERTYLISEDESENIVQEIFIYLWEHRDIIETLQNLNAYLFTLAKNRCIDYFRKEMVRDIRKGSLSEIENRELQLKLYSLEAFDNDRLSDADIEEILNNAINRLPERCREIFIMSRLQNLRYKEIAIRLNVSPNTVENQIAIALRKLKEELKDYFPLFVFII